MLGRLALATILMASTTLPATAQRGGRVLTLDQVEVRFRGMSPVHIRKCDKNGDDLYDQGELACVGSIYNVMYRSD